MRMGDIWGGRHRGGRLIIFGKADNYRGERGKANRRP